MKFVRFAAFRVARSWVKPVLAGALAVSACDTSSGTLAMPPDFEFMTPTGIASVSIRQWPAELSDAEFKGLIAQGMESAMPGSEMDDRPSAPYPTRRIVWHVNSMAQRGVSRLMVNAFDGPDPFAYEEQMVDNSAPTGVLESAITSMTHRLALALDRHDSHEMAAGVRINAVSESENAG